MPQRFLRPGLRTSKRWNSVSRLAQTVYIGLLTLVDDFGQYDGRASIIWADTCTIWNEQNPHDQVDVAAICCALQQLAATKLIEFYDCSDDKTYVQLTQWQERVREGCRRKWGENGKLAASCSKLLQVAASYAPAIAIASTPTPPPSPTPVSAAPPPLEDYEPLRKRICGWFYRRVTTQWNSKELTALKRIGISNPTEDDLRLLDKWFASPDTFHRKDVQTLLNNWNTEIDRARTHEKSKTNNNPTSNGGRPTPAQERNHFIAGADNNDGNIALDMRGLLPPEHPHYGCSKNRAKN